MSKKCRRGWLLSIFVCAAVVSASGHLSAQSDGTPLDQDPLRHYLPDENTFMPVPGGVYALTDVTTDAETIEEQAAQRHGGVIVGYCLRASCRYVSHLAVIQVCNSKIDGPDGSDKLVLAVVRLPFGKKPGFLKSLQGRDYAHNFEAYGPFEQNLPIDSTGKVEELYALAADGVGPIAPLDYLGPRLRQPQGNETLALHMTMYKNDTGTPYPYFQVRHLCHQPVS